VVSLSFPINDLRFIAMLFPPCCRGEFASPTGGEHQTVALIQATWFCRDAKITTEHTEESR